MRLCALRRLGVVWMMAGIGLAAQVTPIPRAGELSGRPFAIEKTWVIGGTGEWDYLTLDPQARQLFVTHQSRVQVVDLDTGAVTGEIKGFSDAHAVVLDPNGQVGYATDGRASLIRVFDRRTFQVTAEIPLPASPRALAFEPQTGMLVAFGALSTPAPMPRDTPRSVNRDEIDPCSKYGGGWPPPPAYQSLVSFIDPGKKTRVADVHICGILGAAQPDGDGQVYFTIRNFNEIGSLNASSVLELARSPGAADLRRVNGSVAEDGTLLLDLRMSTTVGAGSQFKAYSLGEDCYDPRAVAVDPAHNRVFAACANMTLAVLATDSGAALAAMTIGPGVDAMAYDPGRGLIFTANGGGYGSVTVVRQHLTDSYAVIQNLPTMQQARTMAVDPSTGLVYLVTTLYGVNLKNPPMNGLGTLKLNPVDGSFQVLVVGN